MTENPAEETASASTPQQALDRLGITLPPAPASVAAYVGVKKVGPFVLTSGQLPMENGHLAVLGKVGVDIEGAEAVRAARLCAINALAQLESAVGSLDHIEQIVRLEGYVNSAPGFTQQSAIIDGASNLMKDIFGEAGQHTRLAIGVSELPLNAAVELVVWATVKEEK